VRDDRYIWREVGLPLINASMSFAECNYKQAITYFEPIMKLIGSAGGSDVQINLFPDTYFKSLLRVHRYSQAENLLHLKTQGRMMTSLERKWLAESHGVTDLDMRKVV
jgi:hypothetical protein